MRRFPRWPNLKHFNQVTTVNYSDGQSFYDVLKASHLLASVKLLLIFFQCVLPCIVQLLPSNDSLVHCIRAYERYRMMVGMHCMPESRLQRLDVFIENYEIWVSVNYF